MKRLSRLLKLARTPRLLRSVLSLGDYGYLVDTGWTTSVLKGSPVDSSGQPLPWVTLPFIDFIVERLTLDMSLFEYGTGASTQFYASRTKRVDSVEHDADWYALLQTCLPANARVRLVPLDETGSYARACSDWATDYDLIVVDGRDRVNCMRSSLTSLAARGCLILDDSERDQYVDGCDSMILAGFRRLDFWGMAPGLTYKKCTTLFYRRENCLQI
jgi:hypothetical protein